MPISENDISILIPTYRYRDKVVRAVESALASRAGEIIVLDDRGRDGTMERLAEFSDPRLIVRENERNMGLWENHLAALQMATRPWIKFIQADDYLLPKGLAAYAAAVGNGVTVVWGSPTLKDDETGEVWYNYAFNNPIRATPAQIQQACVFVGWLLGTPSHMMLRADVIERDPAAWHTRISADLVIGSIAAARGDTVLLPAGALGHASHPLQDAKTQNPLLGVERMVRSLAYLRARPEPGLRRLANLWAVLNFKPMIRTTASGILKRTANPAKLLAMTSRLASNLSPQDWKDVLASRAQLQHARRYRRTTTWPHDLDVVFSDCVASSMEKNPA